MADEQNPSVVVDESQPVRDGLEVAQERLHILSPDTVRRLGALQVEQVRDETMESFIDQQREQYSRLPREVLIEALLERDRALASEGRAIADGRLAQNLLREAVRVSLAQADLAALRQVQGAGDKGAVIEGILTKVLGAETADRRQLRLRGHTLGPDPEELQAREDRFHGRTKEEK